MIELMANFKKSQFPISCSQCPETLCDYCRSREVEKVDGYSEEQLKDERGDLMEEREIEALAQMPLKGPGLPKGSHRRCPNPQPLRQQNLPRGSTTSELSRAGVGSAQKGTKMRFIRWKESWVVLK